MDNVIGEILLWSRAISAMLLLILYPTVVLLLSLEAYRNKIIRQFMESAKYVLTEVPNCSPEDALEYFDVFYRRSNELRRSFPNLISLIEEVLCRLFTPTRYRKKLRWDQKEILMFIEVFRSGKTKGLSLTLNSEMQHYFDLPPSELESSVQTEWLQSLLKLAMNKGKEEERNAKQYRRQRIVFHMSWVTGVLTVLFGIQNWLD